MTMASILELFFEDDVMFVLLYYKSTEIYHTHIFIPGEPMDIIQDGQYMLMRYI
jgi:hypothetical protein